MFADVPYSSSADVQEPRRYERGRSDSVFELHLDKDSEQSTRGAMSAGSSVGNEQTVVYVVGAMHETTID